jgi:hypothetical protein
MNLVKGHLGRKTCSDQKTQKDKIDKINRTSTKLTTFFGKVKEKATLIPSTVSPALTINSATAPEPGPSNPLFTPPPNASNIEPMPLFMVQFNSVAASLPPTIPLAEDGDVLAKFSHPSELLVGEGTSVDDLWEEVVNPLLHYISWAMSDDELRAIIRRGVKGVDGFGSFVMFWIGKGISASLFESRVERITQIMTT